MKTSPKRSYSVIENERFGLVFAKTVSIISGTGDGSLLYQTDCCTVQTVSCYIRALPSARQSFSYKWGAAGWGGIIFVYVCLEYSDDPPEGHPGQLAYTFLIRVLSPSLI